MSTYRSTTQRKKYYYLLTPSVLSLCLAIPGANAATVLVKPKLFTLKAATISNPITTENAKKGSLAWQHKDRIVFDEQERPAMAVNYATATCSTSASNYPWAYDNCLMGYTSSPSVNKGGSIDFKISVNPAPQAVKIDFFRMGWYGGSGGTLVSTVSNLAGVQQPDCIMNSSTGLTECNWSNTYTLNVPTSWTTGVYLAQLTNNDGWHSEIVFVVKDDSRAADFLYQLPILTYAAYNNYPDGSLMGKSTYESNSSGNNTVVNTPRAAKVSFDRPLHHQFGSWLGTDWTEIHLVAWLEKMGYNINYTTDLDIHNAPVSYLQAYKGIIIGGHSEYWTKAMYDKMVQARDSGVNLAFFGANAAHWQVRMENSTSGVANRVLTCYKDENGTTYDPVRDSTWTKHWRDLSRAEQTLVGVQHDLNGWNLDTANQPPFIAQNTGHWIFNGTGLTDGSQAPYLIGYEIDNLNPAYPKPPLLTPTSQTIIGQSPFTNQSGAAYTSQASIYQAPSKAWVFGAGTMSWSLALTQDSSSAKYLNTGIQQMTKNLLDTFKNSNNQPSANRLPVAVNDSATVNQNASVVVSVLGNDSDPDGNSLTISSVSAAAHGTATNNGTSITYTPVSNYSGSDSFTYTISDGAGGTATATVNITVNAIVNRPPVAANDTASVNQNASVVVSVLSNDSDPDGNSLTVSAVGTAAHGTVVNNGGSVTYTPVSNYTGSDSFTYTISDGAGSTATATVNVTVNAVAVANRNPVANADYVSVAINRSITIYPLSNDTDADGNTLTLTSVGRAGRGNATKSGNAITYTAWGNRGTDTFSYTISDGRGGVATGYITVNITRR